MVAKTIYDMALQILGLKNSDGTDSDDCSDLLNRAPDLINILIHENLPLDRLLCANPNKTANVISSLNDDVDAHDTVLYTVYPYGLAALLIKANNPDYYSVLYHIYTQNKLDISKELPSVRHGIEDMYVYSG